MAVRDDVDTKWLYHPAPVILALCWNIGGLVVMRGNRPLQCGICSPNMFKFPTTKALHFQIGSWSKQTCLIQFRKSSSLQCAKQKCLLKELCFMMDKHDRLDLVRQKNTML